MTYVFLIIIDSGRQISPCVISYDYFLLMQEHHFSMLQHETEKLRGDIEKMRSELRHVLWIIMETFLTFLKILMA